MLDRSYKLFTFASDGLHLPRFPLYQNMHSNDTSTATVPPQTGVLPAAHVAVRVAGAHVAAGGRHAAAAAALLGGPTRRPGDNETTELNIQRYHIMTELVVNTLFLM